MFSLHIFGSMFIEQVIDLKKVRICCIFLSSRLPKNLRIEICCSSCQCRPLHDIAFYLQLIWLQTLFAIDSESCQKLFQSFCSKPCEVAVLFNWNLRRFLVSDRSSI